MIEKYTNGAWGELEGYKKYGEPTFDLSSFPASFQSGGLDMSDYRIYGANDSVGAQTENLFDFEPGMLDESKWTVAAYNYFMYYLLSEDTADRLKRIGAIAGTVYLTEGGSHYDNSVLAITSSPKLFNVTNEERLLQNDGTPMQYSADVSGYSNIYLCIGYGPGISPSNKQILIDSIFNNYYIMLNAGVVPLSYEPFGYQINAVVRSENLFDKDAKDTSNGYVVNSYIDSNGNIRFANLYCVSEYMTVEPNQIYYLKDLVTTGTSCNAAFYDTNKSLISTTSVFNVASLTTPPNAIYMRISFYSTLAYKTMVSTTEITTYQPYSRTDTPIYIGDTPLAQGEYVDYGEQKVYKYVDGTLTPTDPPVALPALPTIDGTTIVDFDNTPKPSRMTGEIIGWTTMTPKIYENGAWT